MIDYRSIEQRLRDTLSLQWRPVGVTFRETPPVEVAKFTGTEPSGCSFWRVAAGGRTFYTVYTVPSDHYNCAIGSHTHNIPLAPERTQELDQTLSFMTGIGYVRMEEIPGIPRLPETPGVVDLRTPRGHAGGPRRGARRRPARATDASVGGRPASRGRVAGPVPRPSDVYGAARRTHSWRHREYGLYR
jgi:hypothetical protein